MTWMLTASGTVFDLRFIAQESIRIEDISHHLAQINRYTGACSRPYSVAEHSLLVAWITEHVLGETDPAVLMAALMHDAHEAYTTDLATPMKQLVGPAWREEENRIQHAVLKRYRLTSAWVAARHQVHRADTIALLTEREQLLPAGGPAWAAEATHCALPERTWCIADLDDWDWRAWRDAFVDRFQELEFARAEQVRDFLASDVDGAAGEATEATTTSGSGPR